MITCAHRRAALGAAITSLVAATVLATTAPSSAAETATTFTLTGGALSVSVPESADLGSEATGAGTVQGSLGPVTVTDDRGLLAAAWTASAFATDFVTGGGSPEETIPAARVTYLSGPATASSPATGVFLGAGSVTLGTSLLPVFTGTATGNNSATWNPTVTVLVPAQAVAGTYTGTITHSVS